MGSPLLSWPVPGHQLRQLVVVVLGSAVGSWTGSDQNVQFRSMIGEPPSSTSAMYLLLDACPGTVLWCFTKSLCPAKLYGWCGQEPQGAEPVEVEGVQQELCCLHSKQQIAMLHFWSRARSLQDPWRWQLEALQHALCRESLSKRGVFGFPPCSHGGNMRDGDLCPGEEEAALFTSLFPSPAGTTVLWLPSQLPSPAPATSPEGWAGRTSYLVYIMRVLEGRLFSLAKGSHEGVGGLGGTPP